MASPHFAMLWSQDIPRSTFTDDAGRKTEVTVVAGQIEAARAPAPPPRSWAARRDTDVAIWCIRLEPGARWTLPAAASAATVRTLYFFRGPSLRVAGEALNRHAAVKVRSTADVALEAGEGQCEILVLQGAPSESRWCSTDRS